jgi:type I restriction enzyme, S subunit
VSELPEGWSFARLPDLVAAGGVFIDGDWVESKDQNPDGDVRLIQLADIGDGRYIDKSNRFLTHAKAVELGCTFLTQGDVLIARMPEPLGRACIFPGDRRHAVTVVDVCVVRGKSEHFDNVWLMHFINSSSFRADIHSLQSGSTRKRISRGNLSTLKLPVPPRAEQSRIVAKLEELLSDLDAGVAELKAVQKKLAQYRQSLLKAAVEGALTAEWREKQKAVHPDSEPVEPIEGLSSAHGSTSSPRTDESDTGAQLLQRILAERRARWEAKQLAKFTEQGKTPPKDWQKKYSEPVQPDTTNLPALPERWVWASVDELCDLVRNGLSKTPNTDQQGFPIFKINAVRPMAVNFEAIKHIELSETEAADYWVESGDVLATRYNGSVDLLGVFGMVKEVPQRTLHPDKLIRMKPVTGVGLGAWLEVCGNIGASRKHLVSRVKTTAGQTGISGDDLKRTPIPVPPTDEQAAAIEVLNERLEGIQELAKQSELFFKQSTAQRQNILRAAFSGQLVPQDPNDEPASVLLERIRAERAAARTNGKTTTRRTRHA